MTTDNKTATRLRHSCETDMLSDCPACVADAATPADGAPLDWTGAGVRTADQPAADDREWKRRAEAAEYHLATLQAQFDAACTAGESAQQQLAAMKDERDEWKRREAFAVSDLQRELRERDARIETLRETADRATARADDMKDERDRAVKDAERLDAVQRESWDLRCFDTHGGEDVGWRVIAHHMAEPHERVVAEVFTDDPRTAIDTALATPEPQS